jgi:hypothetical protein
LPILERCVSRSTHVRDLCYGGIRRQWVASKTSRRHGARGRNPARLDRGMQIDVETGCASPVMIRCSGFYGPRAAAQNLARRLGAVQRAQGPALHFQPSSVRTKSQRFGSTIRSQAEVCCAPSRRYKPDVAPTLLLRGMDSKHRFPATKEMNPVRKPEPSRRRPTVVPTPRT